MIKAIIFDRDGVIIDSEYTNVEAATKAFHDLGISITENEKRQIVGKHPDDYIPYFTNKYKINYDNFRKHQSKHYYALLENVKVFDEVLDLIKKLQELEIPLALTTSSSKKSTDIVLKKLNFENTFNVIVTSEDYSKRKPDPDPYTITARQIKVKPEECIVIEDSEVGVESAKAAGMECIAIPNKYTIEQDFSRADRIIFERNKLEQVIENSLGISL